MIFLRRIVKCTIKNKNTQIITSFSYHVILVSEVSYLASLGCLYTYPFLYPISAAIIHFCTKAKASVCLLPLFCTMTGLGGIPLSKLFMLLMLQYRMLWSSARKSSWLSWSMDAVEMVLTTFVPNSPSKL